MCVCVCDENVSGEKLIGERFRSDQLGRPGLVGGAEASPGCREGVSRLNQQSWLSRAQAGWPEPGQATQEPGNGCERERIR